MTQEEEDEEAPLFLPVKCLQLPLLSWASVCDII